MRTGLNEIMNQRDMYTDFYSFLLQKQLNNLATSFSCYSDMTKILSLADDEQRELHIRMFNEKYFVKSKRIEVNEDNFLSCQEMLTNIIEKESWGEIHVLMTKLKPELESSLFIESENFLLEYDNMRLFHKKKRKSDKKNYYTTRKGKRKSDNRKVGSEGTFRTEKLKIRRIRSRSMLLDNSEK